MLCITGKHGFKCLCQVLNGQTSGISDNRLDIPRRLCEGLQNNISMLSRYGLRLQFVSKHWIVSILVLLNVFAVITTLHCTSTTLINHSTHWVTFALFKKILQTLAFRKYNYLPFHISAANIPALWTVYLIVFVYRLTFFFCWIFIFIK